MTTAYWKGKKLSDEHKKNIATGGKGKKHNISEEGRKKLSDGRLMEKNPAWKGVDVCYGSLHDWIKWHKPKPKKCECCGREVRLDCANISGEYKRDVNDYEWLCRSCHMKSDGRLKAFVENAKSPEFRKKLSDERTGRNNPMYGKRPWLGRHHTEETKRKISEKKKELFKTGKHIHPWIGRHHTKETRKKMSDARKKRNNNS